MLDIQTDKDKQGSKPLVSFIIAYYNIPTDMLKECVNSILQLSLLEHEREIIIVDDGSLRNPLDALQEAKEKVVYIRQKNGGLGAARNTGILAARGEYIQFIDADDYLLPDVYDFCLSCIKVSEFPDMVLFGLTNVVPLRQNLTKSSATSGCEYLKHNNLRASACGYLFRRRILGNLRFTSGILHEDEEFTPLLMLKADQVIETQALPYFYRTRKGSITQCKEKRVQRLDDMEKVILHLKNISQSLPAYESKALLRRIHQLTMDYLFNVMTQTRSVMQLEQRVKHLQREGLFPLPAEDYTMKYRWFRIFTQTRLGRRIFIYLIPQKS